MGKLDEAQLERWAKDFYYYVEPAIPTIAAWLSMAPTLPDREAYKLIARNLAGEMGYIKEAEHHDLYLQFCAGLGITRDDLLEHTAARLDHRRRVDHGLLLPQLVRGRASAPSAWRSRWKCPAGPTARRSSTTA